MTLRARLYLVLASLTVLLPFADVALAQDAHAHGPIVTGRDPNPRQVGAPAEAG